jgi:squalene-hopene/tetraprenyl-beta-curcumene cyclase
VLEVLATYGFTPKHPIVSRAIRFLRKRQEFDGAWYGRWGVNYVYGTWQVLKGLRAIGVNMREPWIQRGRVWLEQHQNPDGGWGESCGSYEDPTLRGRGKSTPSQTAWALMGLLSFAEVARPSIRRGVEYLLSNQNSDGSWDEHLITGTGFPRVFYLKYDMYRNNWPLLALSFYAKKLANTMAPESKAVLREQRGNHRSALEPAFATLASGFSSLPGIELLRELLTKLNHG